MGAQGSGSHAAARLARHAQATSPGKGVGGTGDTVPPGRARARRRAGGRPRGGDRPVPSEDVPAEGTAAAAARPASGWRALLAPPGEAYVPPAQRERPWWGFGDVMLWYGASFVVGMFVPVIVAV